MDKRLHLSALIKASLGCVILMGLGGVASAQERSHPPVAFHIEPVSLKTALTQFGEQTGFSIMFSKEAVEDLKSQGVIGEYDPETALQRLLDRTGLGYAFVDPRTIAIGGAETAEQSMNKAALRFAQRDKNHSKESIQTSSVWDGLLVANSTDATAASDETTTAERLTLEEIVVTARKTEESLQRVPVSVAVVSGEEIEARSIRSLSDLGQSTPNFTFGTTAPSGRNNGSLFMRGVGPTTGAPTVGIYVDGVYLGDTRGNDLETLDLERVEVLRGPQGTLFGKNASGGAISIITRKPDASADGFSGRVQLTGGSRNRFDVLSSVNLPLVADRLALQTSVSRRKQDGYTHRADGQDQSSTDRWSGRFALGWTPMEQFSALLSADALTYDETAGAHTLRFINTDNSAAAFNNLFVPQQYDPRWYPPNDYFSYSAGSNSSRGTIWGTALTLDYDFGGVTLKSISGYRKLNAHDDQDPDGSPVTILNFDIHNKSHQFTQEFQLSGGGFDDRLKWTVGTYYYHQSYGGGASDNYILTELATALFQNPYIFSIAGQSFGSNESRAVFAQANYNLTDKLRATVGVRRSRDEAKARSLSWTLPDHVVTSVAPPQRQSWNDTSPRFGLDYQWTSDLMTYVSAARGYKAGGFDQQGIPGSGIQPEEVWTYEAGLRSDWFERRVRFNATYFYSDYKDLQMSITGSTNDPVTGAPIPFGLTDNIPRVRITGGEVDLNVIAFTGLTLSGSLGITDAKYIELPADDPRWQATALAGDSINFPFTPKVSYTFAAEYQRAIMADMMLTARIDYSHRDDVDFHPENTTPMHQPAYSLINARLTFEHEPSGVSLAVFGSNLTDKSYITGGYDDATVANAQGGLGFAVVNRAPPREFGVTAQWQFR